MSWLRHKNCQREFIQTRSGMWRHIEPQKLSEAARGAVLDQSECEHVASCQLCQELLVFFLKQIATSPDSKPNVKAA